MCTPVVTHKSPDAAEQRLPAGFSPLNPNNNIPKVTSPETGKALYLPLPPGYSEALHMSWDTSLPMAYPVTGIGQDKQERWRHPHALKYLVHCNPDFE